MKIKFKNNHPNMEERKLLKAKNDETMLLKPIRQRRSSIYFLIMTLPQHDNAIFTTLFG